MRGECWCAVALAEPARVSLEGEHPAYVEPPPEARALCTRDDAIFGLATPAIAEAADRLAGEHPDPARRAQAIHDFVAATIACEGGGWDPAPRVPERILRELAEIQRGARAAGEAQQPPAETR